jgi:hypothetical protein
MLILSHSDVRAFSLGIAQLIPVFLISFFVLDNSWIRRSAQELKAESFRALEEARDVILGRSESRGTVEDALKDLDRFSEVIDAAEASRASEDQNESIEKAREKVRLHRAKILGIADRYEEATGRIDRLSDRLTGVAENMEESAKRRVDIYNIITVCTIIFGMVGEVISLWGAIGLLDGVAVIEAEIVVCASLAGILSVLAIDRLISDTHSRFIRRLRQSWAALLAILIVLNGVWILTVVKIKN